MTRLSDIMRAVCGAALGIAALVATTSAQAVEWKMHLVWNDQRLETQWTKTWADRIRERSDGKLDIKLFPGGSLGVNTADMLRILPLGNLVQATMLHNIYISRDDKELALANVGGFASKETDILKLMPIMDEIYESAYKRWGIKYLGTVIAPDASIAIFCKQPFTSLADLKGRKLRTWGGFDNDVFNSLGVQSVVLGQNDLYLALQTGVVDCAQFYPSAALAASIQEVAPYYSHLSALASPLSYLVSQTAWDALSPDLQQIVLEETAKIKFELMVQYLNRKHQLEGRANFNAKGGKEQKPLPEADVAAYNQAVRKIWERDAEKAGKSILDNYRRLQEAMKKGHV